MQHICEERVCSMKIYTVRVSTVETYTIEVINIRLLPHPRNLYTRCSLQFALWSVASASRHAVLRVHHWVTPPIPSIPIPKHTSEEHINRQRRYWCPSVQSWWSYIYVLAVRLGMTLRKPGIDQNRCQERSEDDVARTEREWVHHCSAICPTHYWGTTVAPLQMIGNTTLFNLYPGHFLCANQKPTGKSAPTKNPR